MNYPFKTNRPESLKLGCIAKLTILLNPLYMLQDDYCNNYLWNLVLTRPNRLATLRKQCTQCISGWEKLMLRCMRRQRGTVCVMGLISMTRAQVNYREEKRASGFTEKKMASRKVLISSSSQALCLYNAVCMQAIAGTIGIKLYVLSFACTGSPVGMNAGCCSCMLAKACW